MVKHLLHRGTALLVSATTACAAFSGLAAADNFSASGPNSTINSYTNTNTNCRVRNTNTVYFTDYNPQTATTGNVTSSYNTGIGSSWSGWSGLDPALYQSNGQSFDAWWNDVSSWMDSHSNDAGWSATPGDSAWAPSGSDWSSWDPMTWQINGQGFDSWHGQASSYLNSNRMVWMLSWPASATGSGEVRSGDASNNHSSNVSFNINNGGYASPVIARACGIAVMPSNTGSGSGGTVQAPGNGSSTTVLSTSNNNGSLANSTNVGGTSTNPQGAYSGGLGGGYTSGYGGGSGNAGNNHQTNGNGSINNGGSGGGFGSGPAAPSEPSGAGADTYIDVSGPNATATYTGTTSSSAIVSNDTNVWFTNNNPQTATSGNVTSSYNGATNTAGSGNANNGDGTGVSFNVTN